MAKRKSGKTATENQVNYANLIASSIGSDLRFSVEDSSCKVSKFIKDNMSDYRKMENRKCATEKQVEYANTISKTCDLGVMFDKNSPSKDVSDFITKHKDEFEYAERRGYICDNNTQQSQTDIPKDSMLFICDNLFKKSGLYAFLGENNSVLYIGKSTDLSSRIPTSYEERRKYAKIKRIMYYVDENMANVNTLELLLISEYSPILNKDCRTEYKSTMFQSGIDVLKDFKEVPHFGKKKIREGKAWIDNPGYIKHLIDLFFSKPREDYSIVYFTEHLNELAQEDYMDWVSQKYK